METLEVIHQRQLDETEVRHARWEAEDAAAVLKVLREGIEVRISQLEQNPVSEMLLYCTLGFLDGVRDSKSLKYAELDKAYKRVCAVTVKNSEKVLRARQNMQI